MLHFSDLNHEKHPNQEGFRKLINIAAKTGCNYFCTNVKVTIRNSCEHIDKQTNYSCMSCGSKDIDYGTRIIGYLKRVSAFSTPRQKEHELRHYHNEKEKEVA